MDELEFRPEASAALGAGADSAKWFSRAALAVATGLCIASAPGCLPESGDPDYSSQSPAQENADSLAGDFYDDFLTSKYAKLVIEVDVMDGAAPDEEAFETLVDTITMLCNKPGGVEVRFPDDVIVPASSEANPTYTLDDINALEQQYRDSYTDGDTAVLYFIYVNGHSDYDNSDTKVLGYAYHGSSMAIFMGTIMSYKPFTQPLLEKTVTVHEFGHEIGLVDNGADMVNNHLDPDSSHGPHCSNGECIMYWLNNSSIAKIISGELPDFDSDCLDDIAHAGGKDAHGVAQPD
jgi:hypothetical protein